MSLSIVTPPYAEPLSLAEARLHVKADGTEDDGLINGAIAAVRAHAEHETGRQLVAARLRQTLDAFPGRWWSDSGQPGCDPVIVLERAPVLQVVSIQYVATDGTLTTLDDELYQVDYDSVPARIAPAYGQTWPCTRDQLAAVTVTFVAGHAAPFTADAAADTITVRGWPVLAVDDVIRLSNSGGALPAPLAANTDYYVQTVVGAGVYKLSATEGGSAIDITDAGSGISFVGEVPEAVKSWMKLRLGSLDLNRESEIGGSLQELPFIDRLLDPHRVYGV